jgi:two-component system chemotaxis response regulator CheB
MDLVVIGGSAGALDVLFEIVRDLQPAVPIAVALHQAPGHPSMLAQILARESGLRAREPDDKEPLAVGTIYVAPPDYHMLIERDFTIALSIDAPVRYSRPSIDMLFESAAALGVECTGVLLSGANDDGARGLCAIATAGGTAVVQDPETAAYPLMPTTARPYATHVLSPPEIARFVGGLGRKERHER